MRRMKYGGPANGRSLFKKGRNSPAIKAKKTSAPYAAGGREYLMKAPKTSSGTVSLTMASGLRSAATGMTGGASKRPLPKAKAPKARKSLKRSNPASSSRIYY